MAIQHREGTYRCIIITITTSPITPRCEQGPFLYSVGYKGGPGSAISGAITGTDNVQLLYILSVCGYPRTQATRLLLNRVSFAFLHSSLLAGVPKRSLRKSIFEGPFLAQDLPSTILI